MQLVAHRQLGQVHDMITITVAIRSTVAAAPQS